MNAKTRKIIIFSLLIVTLYIGFKYYCYNMYGPGTFLELSNVKISGNMTINHTELNEDEYFIFKDIKVKNVFEGFEQNNLEGDAFLRMVKKEGSQVSQAIILGSEKQYIDILKTNKEYKGIFNKIAENENINDDIDLLKYMEKHNDDEVKFFMTLRRQKQIDTINEFKISMLPSIEYINLVDGYYDGYMYKSSAHSSEVVIIKNNKRYFFSFLGNYTEEFINDFMNTVVIE